MSLPTERAHLDPWAPAPTWRDLAACADVARNPRHPAEPSWWDVANPTSDPDGHHLEALAICQTCPVADQCLTDAHHRHDRYSVRGGQMPSSWRPVRRNQQQENAA